MRAHIIDTEILMSVPASAWIIDKDRPNIPVMKIDRDQLEVLSSGIYRKQNNRMDFDGKTYWLPNDLMDTLILKCKKSNSDPTNLALSIQEFLNPGLMDRIEPTFDMSILNHIMNTPDHIYLICSTNTEKAMKGHMEKLSVKIKDEGLDVKGTYYLTESWKRKENDTLSNKKIQLCIQHLIGLKMSGEGFSDEDNTTYHRVEFYDRSHHVIETGKKVNELLFRMVEKSEKNLIPIIKERVKGRDLVLTLNRWTDNRMNRIEKTLVPVSYSNIASFESFQHIRK